MRMLWFWFVFGVFFTLAIIMIVFGIHFIGDIYYSEGENVFASLMMGIVLLLAGGGLLSSTVAETVRKFLKK